MPELQPVEPRRQEGAADTDSLVELGLADPPPEPAPQPAPTDEPV